MASVKFIPCKCGCGCGHHCQRLYGPYFNRSVRRQGRITSEYLGGLREAAEAVSGARSGGAYEKTLTGLMKTALKRARAWEQKGYRVADPREREDHIGRGPAQAKRRTPQHRRDRELDRFFALLRER